MEAEFKMYHQQGKEDQGLMATIKNKEDNKFLFEVMQFVPLCYNSSKILKQAEKSQETLKAVISNMTSPSLIVLLLLVIFLVTCILRAKGRGKKH